jgi:DNA invertase Pin-like site-specific DNA recombinase
MSTAFGYLRVSGKGQLDGDGFTRQREAIERFAAANGITITQWFEERGVCLATELDNRPALQELVAALHSNGTRLVLIEKLDRLARDLMVQETIIRDFRKDGFQIISTMEPDLCSDDPSRKFVRQVFGALAEYDRMMIVAKLRAARQRIRAKTGRCEGRKPYGDQGVIEQITQLHRGGLNYTQIAGTLNDQGIKSSEGKAWYPASVSRVVSRLVICEQCTSNMSQADVG